MNTATLCDHEQQRDTLDWTGDAFGGVAGKLWMPAVGALKGGRSA